jgi:hypothetical protein
MPESGKRRKSFVLKYLGKAECEAGVSGFDRLLSISLEPLHYEESP